MRTRRTVVLGAALAGVLLLGIGAWSVVSGDEEPSPEDAVTAFFEARRHGDCAGLLDVVSEASWSENGRLSREEFLTICADALEDDPPRLHAVHVRSIDGDRASVRLAIPVDEDERADAGAAGRGPEGIVVNEMGDTSRAVEELLAYADGHLVRENGEWKVQLDHRALGLGRSPEQTVRGFLEAYRAGDCESLLDHLSERAWSRDGRTDRARFLDRCSAEAEARGTLPADETLWLSTTPQIGMPRIIEVSAAAGTATADIVIPWHLATTTETVRLVVEDLQWKVDTAVFEPFEYIELGTHLLGRPKRPDPLAHPSTAEAIRPNQPASSTTALAYYEGDDAAGIRRKFGFRRGLSGVASRWRDGTDLLLYEFADAAGARAYARHLWGRIVTVATRYQDVSPVPIRGVPGGKAIVTECAGPVFRPRSEGGDCSKGNQAAAVATHGRYLVAVEATDYTTPDPTAAQMAAQAAKAVKAQLDLL